MTAPLVSVVMSVYNGERFLAEAVESILDQSFREFEFIIVNDGSTDGSGALLDSFQRGDSRIHIYNQEHRGLIDSLNQGCKLARGKYIGRMDADDIAIRDRLTWQVDFLEKHPEVGVVGGAIECINAKGESLRIHRHPIKDPEIKAALYGGGVGFCHPTVVIRSQVLASVGGYRKGVVHAEDYDLWLRISDRFQMANLGSIVLKYRLHSQQVCARTFKQMALTRLAARTAAYLRRNGDSDRLDSIAEITPAVLAGFGVDEATQQTWAARQYLTYAKNMSDAGEEAISPEAVLAELRSSELRYAKRPVVADFLLWAAKLYWRDRKFVRSMLTAGQGLIVWPILLGRPIKPFLRRFG